MTFREKPPAPSPSQSSPVMELPSSKHEERQGGSEESLAVTAHRKKHTRSHDRLAGMAPLSEKHSLL